MNATADEEVLGGGVANAGAVVRVGTEVRRPSNPHTDSIHRALSQLAAAGFDGAPVPLGRDATGRERLRFIPGSVATPPYPAWAQSDEALASIARLLRRLHGASEGLELHGESWSEEMADPLGGPVLCHNDVCLENVVFRDGAARALVDFDFASPGRAAFDLAAFARMCVPIDDDRSADALGWIPADRPARLRLVCDVYGLDAAGRAVVIASLDDAIARGGEFVRAHVERGDPGFVQMWADMGGMARYDRRRAWWTAARDVFAAACA